MERPSKDIIAQLRKDLLVMGGLKIPAIALSPGTALPFMRPCLPNGCFPLAAVHEFLSAEPGTLAPSQGFIAALVHLLFPQKKVIAWVTSSKVFPPALKNFGISPDQVLFIHPSGIKESLWVTEEALRCRGITAVVTELNGFDFTQSRRFQLAVEQSGVTGFILNSRKGNAAANACVSRWQIRAAPSQHPADLPGVGLPAWEADLQKMRNGKKGNWVLQWKENRMQQVILPVSIAAVERKKIAG